jgi:uncharacterized protein YbaP (TraB family)
MTAITALLALLAPLAAGADGGHHMLWAVQGRHATVYLLGSVHVLKPEQSALPAEAQAAYAESGKVMLEVALDSAQSPGALQAATLAQGLLPAGQSLRDTLGEPLYRRFSEHARTLGLDAELVRQFQPWLAALTLQQLQLANSGYEAGAGVDLQLAGRAQADHKTIVGLETLEEQFGLFAQLTPVQQREFLEQTLDEVDEGDAEVDDIVNAWRQGDARRLAAVLQKSREESPELFRLLTTDRNHRWLPKILALLAGDEDCLVIVGALHLVGSEGLIDLLEKRGYHPVQQ